MNGRGLFRRTRSAGAALVLILCAVVLLSVVCLAFLASITLERRASDTYAHGAEVRLLADSVVNVVMGQIRQATENDGEVWTSQPGLLRTFSASGEPGPVYKLYSSSNLIQPAASFDPSADVPADWAKGEAEQRYAADYVDLNEPAVSRRENTLTTNYPILDPRGEGRIEGFSISNSAYGAAMPVAWLYLLSDGRLVRSSELSAANPPLARVAFWTDDETCKLNINTASEGNYWDTPKATTPDEYRMATNQPAQREFQSYPGHPATTSLSPVLYSYFKAHRPGLLRENSAISTNTFPELLYAMLPRTSAGGSRGGQVRLEQANNSLPLKIERLFDSVDELAFRSPSGGNLTNREVNELVDREVIQQAQFFLTAYSRAPELNLFNLPKVTIWPVHEQTGNLYRTPFDNLIAFASTINGGRFYFTRANSESPDADFSGRNVDIYRYLQKLTSAQVPGFGGSFEAKYGADRDQILTEIFDYVRSVNLTDTSSGLANFHTFTTNTYKEDAQWGGHAGVQPEARMGQVVPIAPPGGGPGAGTRGFGRFQTINRALLVLSAIRNQTSGTSTNTVMEAVLFLEPFSPSQGHALFRPYYNVRVTTVQPVQVSSAGVTNSVSFSGANRVDYFGSQLSSKNAGGFDGFAPAAISLNGKPAYPLISAAFTNVWNGPAPTLELRGGELRAEIRTIPSTTYPKTTTLQTITFSFPTNGVTVPMPTVGAVTPYSARFAAAMTPGAGGDNHLRGAVTSYWVTTNDVARSLEATGVGGDLRLTFARVADTNSFQPVDGYASSDQRRFSALASLGEAMGGLVSGPAPETASPLDVRTNGNLAFGRLVRDAESEITGPNRVNPSMVPPNINGVVNAFGAPGDWDTGIGTYPNGPLINKSDDGNSPRLEDGLTFTIPYLEMDEYSLPPGKTFSSPSRQLPSAVMFGSLPSGVKAGNPWQTLLFCPNPASRYGAVAAPHFGEGDPKDHLLLDLFHIPVVEPYAISEPFSTAGKVNLNAQIIPFTGISRFTALYGVLEGVKITALNDGASGLAHYKKTRGGSSLSVNYRYAINIPETLSLVKERFATNGVYKSASEICEIPLLPDPSRNTGDPHPWSTPVTRDNLDAFWKFNRFTGDNLRENPYALLYPRLTARSNTYTVHVRVQTLKKLPKTDPQRWEENRDRITGEFRGAFLIERYLDPGDTSIPDAAMATNPPKNLNGFYRYRVISATQFDP